MSQSIHLVSENAVFVRTEAGQQELIAGSRLLSRVERRLLAMVTGLTSVHVLVGMGLDITDLRFALAHLLDLHLVQLASIATS